MVMALLTEVCVLGGGMLKYRDSFTYRSHDLTSRYQVIQEVRGRLFLSLTTVWNRGDCDVQPMPAECTLRFCALSG